MTFYSAKSAIKALVFGLGTASLLVMFQNCGAMQGLSLSSKSTLKVSNNKDSAHGTSPSFSTPVYRFYSAGSGEHFFTLNYNEGSDAGFLFEGTGFQLSPTQIDGSSAVYRCYMQGVMHFASQAPNCEGQVFEGLLGYSLNSPAPGTTALYRMYNAGNFDHLETTNPQEGLAGGYVLEGILGYVALPIPTQFVYIGGVQNMPALISQANVASMLSSGKIGLYMHANGVAPLFASGQLSALLNTWLPTGTDPSGNFQAVGEVAGFTSDPGAYKNYFGGRYPNEVNMNIITGSGDGSGVYTATANDKFPGRNYTGYVSDADLVQIKAAIDVAGAAGAKSVGVYITPNGGGEDLDDAFATSPYWANVRAAALYGGGLGFDTPPNYVYLRSGSITGPGLYAPMVVQMIKWCNQNHLRSSLTVSPFINTIDSAGNSNGMGYEADFLEMTQKFVIDLWLQGATPSQYIVENYGLGGDGNQPMTDSTAESLNVVALYLAGAHVSPPGTRAGQFAGAQSQAQIEAR